MIDQNVAPTALNVAGDRVTVEVLGRKKLVATALPDGLSVWCKVFSSEALIPYAQLMSIPSFRSGVLAVLAGEVAVDRLAG